MSWDGVYGKKDFPPRMPYLGFLYASLNQEDKKVMQSKLQKLLEDCPCEFNKKQFFLLMYSFGCKLEIQVKIFRPYLLLRTIGANPKILKEGVEFNTVVDSYGPAVTEQNPLALRWAYDRLKANKELDNNHYKTLCRAAIAQDIAAVLLVPREIANADDFKAEYKKYVKILIQGKMVTDLRQMEYNLKNDQDFAIELIKLNEISEQAVHKEISDPRELEAFYKSDKVVDALWDQYKGSFDITECYQYNKNNPRLHDKILQQLLKGYISDNLTQICHNLASEDHDFKAKLNKAVCDDIESQAKGRVKILKGLWRHFDATTNAKIEAKLAAAASNPAEHQANPDRAADEESVRCSDNDTRNPQSGISNRQNNSLAVNQKKRKLRYFNLIEIIAILALIVIVFGFIARRISSFEKPKKRSHGPKFKPSENNSRNM